MGPADFKTIFSGVRPARVAVLLRQDDTQWQDTCRRIIECLSWTWGGKYSLIIPTDGKVIKPLFWELLESFDPDYIYQYQETGRDWKIASPEQYRELLNNKLKEQFGDQAPPKDVADRLDEAIEKTPFSTPGVTLELEEQLKSRLAAFYFQQHTVVGNVFTAGSDAGYPLTDLSVLLPNCEHPSRLSLIDTNVPGISPLWIESVVGATYEEHKKLFSTFGIALDRVLFDDSTLNELFDLVMEGRIDPIRRSIGADGTGGIHETPPDYLATSPFQFSMLSLSRYRSVKERAWEMPAVVVVGSTLEDFALYFDLSRIRSNIYWLPPAWLSDFKTALARATAGGSLVAPSEMHARRFAHGVLHVFRSDGVRHLDFVSASCDTDQLLAAIEDLDSASAIQRGEIRSRGRVRESVNDLLSHPQVVFNTDNFAIPTNQQVLEGKVAGIFPTPKPKGFTKIVPYDHRWITELRVEGIAYPRHPSLGEWIIRHPALTTHEARTGKRGICYFCPNVGYFGGDVDTILVRPELYVPDAAAVFQRLAESVGWTTHLSDKGFFSRDTVQKVGTLEATAELLRYPRHSAVLNEYLEDSKSQSKSGIFLASDRRRYLDLEAVIKIVGDTKAAVLLIDLLVANRILHRGLILKCEYCRSADWFSLGDLDDGFRCKRCRRQQPILSGHALERPEPRWFYQLDEIVYQGLRNDMAVPLLALDYLRRKSSSFMHTDELEIWRGGEPHPFIEIDICCICDGMLTIGEAKSTERIEGGGKRERRTLNKYKKAALGLGATRFVLATSKSWSTETRANAANTFGDVAVEVVYLTGPQLVALP